MISLITDSLSGEFVIVHGGHDSNVRTVSKRQVQILSLAAAGKSMNSIGQQISVTEEALRKDIAKLCEIFEVKNLQQAVVIAKRLELVDC